MFLCPGDHEKMTNEYGNIAQTWKAISSAKKSHKTPIDKSTTFYKLHDVTEDCLMDEFATNFYPDYDPSDGFGYYELLSSTSSNEISEIESSSDVIVLNEVNHSHKIFNYYY